MILLINKYYYENNMYYFLSHCRKNQFLFIYEVKKSKSQNV